MRHVICITGLASLTFACGGASCLAQGRAQSEIVVPSFSTFSVGTTISLPDRANSYLGGLDRASDRRTEFGPGFGRGLSSTRNASGAGAHVWIHDFDELEQGLASGRGGAEDLPLTGFAGRVQEYGSTRSNTKAKETASRDARASKADSEAEFKLAHAADLLKRGKEAEERGKLKVAALYYKSVISLGTTPSATSARQQLTLIESKLASR